jgi:hypothetical protein
MEPAAYVLLAVKASILLTVFGLGLNAEWRDAMYLFRRPSLLIKSLLSMNVVMPPGLVVTFDLPTSVKVALVALAISPVPPMLPKKEKKAGGEQAYAIGLLVAVALLAIVTVPIIVSWFIAAFNRTGGIAPLGVAKIVFASVLAPLAIGIAVRQWDAEACRPYRRHGRNVRRHSADRERIAVALLLLAGGPGALRQRHRADRGGDGGDRTRHRTSARWSRSGPSHRARPVDRVTAPGRGARNHGCCRGGNEVRSRRHPCCT